MQKTAIKRIFFLACGVVALAPRALACAPAPATTKDHKIAVAIRVAAGDCAKTPAAPFTTADSYAVELRPPADFTVTAVSLRQARGNESSKAPNVRRQPDGAFYADGLTFSTPGDWTLVATVERAGQSDDVSSPVTAALPDDQRAEIYADKTLVPDFAMTDQSGAKIGRADLKGHVWLASLVFTSCPKICPMTAQALAGLQREFKGKKAFRIVSVTTDPNNDTGEALAAFAARAGADQKTWRLLRGDKPEVVKFANDGLKLATELASPAHSTKIALVGKDGIVTGRYDAMKPEELAQLKLDLAATLAR